MARDGRRVGKNSGESSEGSRPRPNRRFASRVVGAALLIGGLVSGLVSVAPHAAAEPPPLLSSTSSAPRASASSAPPTADPSPGHESGLVSSVLSDVAGPAPSEGVSPPPITIPPDFGTFSAGPIEIRYAPGLRGQARRLSEQTHEIRKEHSALLGRETLTQPATVIVARDAAEMRRLAPSGAPPPSYAQGVAYPGWRLILLSYAPVKGAEFPDLLEVYSHELSHLALRDALGAGAVPLWFNEGFSVYASGEAQVARLETLWLATVGGNLLGLKELERGIPANRSALAYAQSADLVRFLLRRGDRHRFDLLLDGVAKGKTFEASLRNAHGISLEALEREWRADAESRFTVWPIILGSGTFWVLAVGLFGWAWWRRKRRNRVVLERWAREEELERQRQIAQQLRLMRARPLWLSANSAWPAASQQRFRTLN